LDEASGVILPESIRHYKTPLLQVAAAPLPGYYKLVTEYRDETQNAVKTMTVGFWYAGSLILWALVVLGAGVLGLAVWYARRWWMKRRGRRPRKK
jgi:hypothetical protein